MKDDNKKYFSLVGIGLFALSIIFLLAMVEQAIAGHLFGEQAFAAIGAAYSFDLVIEVFEAVILVGMGVRLFAAQETGSPAAIRRVFSTALYFSIIIGALCGLVIWGFRYSFAEFYGLNVTHAEYFVRYLKYSAISIALTPVAGVLCELILCDNDLFLHILVFPVQLIGNFAGSWFLGKYFNVEGIALGGILGKILAITVCLFHFKRVNTKISLGIEFSLTECKRMIQAAIGDMCAPLFVCIISIIVNKVVLKRMGSECFPLAVLMLDIIDLTVIFDAFGSALEPIIGPAFANRRLDAIQKILKTANIAMFAAALIISVTLYAYPQFILLLLSIDEPELVINGIYIIRIMCISFTALAITTFYNTAYQLVDHPWYSFWITFLVRFIMPLLAIITIPLHNDIRTFATMFSLLHYVGILIFILFICFCRRGRCLPLLLPYDLKELGSVESQFSNKKRFIRFTPLRLALSALAVYVLIIFSAFWYWTAIAQKLCDSSLDNLEQQWRRIAELHPTRKQIQEYARGMSVSLEIGACFTLGEDGETVDMAGIAEHGKNVFSKEFGWERSAIDSHNTHLVTSCGVKCLYRVFRVENVLVGLCFDEGSMYRYRDRAVALTGIVLLLVTVLLIFLVAPSLNKEEEKTSNPSAIDMAQPR